MAGPASRVKTFYATGHLDINTVLNPAGILGAPDGGYSQLKAGPSGSASTARQLTTHADAAPAGIDHIPYFAKITKVELLAHTFLLSNGYKSTPPSINVGFFYGGTSVYIQHLATTAGSFQDFGADVVDITGEKGPSPWEVSKLRSTLGDVLLTEGDTNSGCEGRCDYLALRVTYIDPSDLRVVA